MNNPKRQLSQSFKKLNSDITLQSVFHDQKKYDRSLIFQTSKSLQQIQTQQNTNVPLNRKHFNKRIQFNNDIMSTMQGEERQMFQIQSAKKLIFIAVEKGDLKLVKQLLDTYPLPYQTWIQRNYSQDTLLHCCVKYSKIKLIDYFLDINYDIINIDNKQKKTPINYAFIYNIQILQYLITKWENIIKWDHQDGMKNTYIDYCEFFECKQSIKSFIYTKVKIKNKNQIKNIPFQQDEKINFFSKKGNSEKKIHLRNNFSKLLQSIHQIYYVKQQFSININSFQILSRIDSGAFAQVFKVKQKISKKIYALKAIQKSKLTHQYYHKYVKIQKQILLISNHPNIVKLYCTFQNQHFLFLLLEFCQFGSIKSLIYSNITINQSTLKLFINQIVEAIQYLHNNSVIYRDLKLQNICMDQQGCIKLVDFGLSKKLRSNFTTKSICGTYQYLPPEMISRQLYTFTVDWYMLGIVIYEILMKKTPFSCNNFGGCRQILTDKIPQIFGISNELQDLIYKLTQKQQEKRLGRNNDGKEIKNHPWFSDISWKSCYQIHNLHLLFKKVNIQAKIQQNWVNYFHEFDTHKMEEQFVETDGWSIFLRSI